MLLTQQAGYLEAEEGERSARFTQSLICKNVDENTRRKQIDLKLTELGPYRRVLLLFRCRLRLHLLLLLHLLYARNRHSFSRNGRYMMLGGRLGHLSSMDWQVTAPPRCTRLLAPQQGCVCHVTRALRPAASNLKSTCGRLCGTLCTCTTTPWWPQHSASTLPPLPSPVIHSCGRVSHEQHACLAHTRFCRYVYIYDNTGAEVHPLPSHAALTCFGCVRLSLLLQVHCLRSHVEPNRLQFLPFHFLLASVGNAGHNCTTPLPSPFVFTYPPMCRLPQIPGRLHRPTRC